MTCILRARLISDVMFVQRRCLLVLCSRQPRQCVKRMFCFAVSRALLFGRAQRIASARCRTAAACVRQTGFRPSATSELAQSQRVFTACVCLPASSGLHLKVKRSEDCLWWHGEGSALFRRHTVIPALRAEDKTPVSVCQVYKRTQTQQQRPESPTVTLTWHGSKYKVHKLLQRYIL